MKVYISGAIGELPYDQVKEKFESAEKMLQARGHQTVNPLNNGLSFSDPWERHIAKDLILLAECDAIYLLPCWQDSVGAKVEKEYAQMKNIHVLKSE